ncbi:hypothetical protein CFP56_007995 [Quercus suber]|uniref:Uncharacterized protein n=1 Tax=Quercus suber TaxID=58331 RepID=A0AAW0L7M7_QUESU
MALPVISCTTYDTSVYRTLLYARSSNLFTMTVSGLSLAACSIASRAPRLRDSEIKILQHSSTDCSMVFFLSFCKRSQHSKCDHINCAVLDSIFWAILLSLWWRAIVIQHYLIQDSGQDLSENPYVAWTTQCQLLPISFKIFTVCVCCAQRDSNATGSVDCKVCMPESSYPIPPPRALTILAILRAIEKFVDKMGMLYNATHGRAPIIMMPLAQDTSDGPSLGFSKSISGMVHLAHWLPIKLGR